MAIFEASPSSWKECSIPLYLEAWMTAQQGHSCTIGNMHVPGTSENQNRQFHEIHHFCPIFTIEYYIVAQKHIRQS